MGKKMAVLFCVCVINFIDTIAQGGVGNKLNVITCLSGEAHTVRSRHPGFLYTFVTQAHTSRYCVFVNLFAFKTHTHLHTHWRNYRRERTGSIAMQARFTEANYSFFEACPYSTTDANAWKCFYSAIKVERNSSSVQKLTISFLEVMYM